MPQINSTGDEQLTFIAAAFASSWAYALFRFFRRLGVFGLVLLSALDSSFLFLPFGNDLMLIALVSRDRSVSLAIAYVVACVVGSVIGVFIIDSLMRKTGEKGLERFVSETKIARLKQKLEKKAWLTVGVATLLPPPFPFTPVIMTASALQTPRKAIIAAVVVGRVIRFSLEATLALYFGRRVLAILMSPWVEYFVYGLIVIAIIGSVFSILKWVKRETLATAHT